MSSVDTAQEHIASLQQADPRWRRRLSAGTTWLAGAIGTSLLMSYVAGGWIVAGIASTMEGGEPTFSSWLILLPTLIPLGLALVGAWVFTSPEPGRPAAVPPSQARLLTRWILTTAILLLVALGPFVLESPVVLSAVALAGALKLTGYAALAHYACGILGRIPKASLAAQMLLLEWALIGCAAMSAVAVALAAVESGWGQYQYGVATNLLDYIVGVMYLAILIWGLVVVLLMRGALRDPGRAADRSLVSAAAGAQRPLAASATRARRAYRDVAYACFLYFGAVVIAFLVVEVLPLECATVQVLGMLVGVPVALSLLPVGAAAIGLAVWQRQERALLALAALSGGVPLTLLLSWVATEGGRRPHSILDPLAMFWAIVCLLAVIILPMRWYLWGRRRFMETYGRGCPTCGYPIGASAVCSECGSDLTAVGETPTPRSAER